jgi:molybdate transport system substrate-binding protein
MTGIFTRAALAASLTVAASAAYAADLKVFSTIGVQAALEQLEPQFEKESGAKLSITWATAAMLVKRVAGGESADCYVLTSQGLDDLVKTGKASDGADATFASSGIAMVVKMDTAKPDISTPDAFKQALLKAKAIAYSNPTAGGASGVYIAKLLEKMGIAEELKAKTRHPPAGGNAANLVVSGEADLAIQQEPEVISVAGVDLVGPLPAPLNNITRYAAGPNPGSAQAAACQALVKFLHSDKAKAVFKARGLKPEGGAKAS